LDPLPHFDLVIVDEAHNIRNANTWAYRGVELFCRNADAVVFLTATPLQNSNNDLYPLLNLLRPDVIIDKDTFKIYSEKESLWNPLKLEDYNISLVEFENAAKEKAIASGILERSDEQARNLVREFISSLPNTGEYTISFAD
jgi:SNF2 family DNA or RNA helicase